METIELPQVVLRRIAVGGMDNNVYLLTARSDGAQLLVDAAADADAIESLIVSAAHDGPSPRLDHLLTTHSHHDHLGALAAVAAAHSGAEVLAGQDDVDAITAATGVTVTRRLHHGETVRLGELELRVLVLRGHTPGSVGLACVQEGAPTQLFTGDSLFPGGVGNTGRNATRFASLLGDVTERIFDAYDDDTVVWPGHGRPTTLGAERPHLKEWRDRGW